MIRRASALIAVVVLLGGSVVAPFVAAPVPVPPMVEPAEPPPSPSTPTVMPAESSTTAPPDPSPAPPVPPTKDEKPPCGVASDASLERWIDQASAALGWHGEPPITDRAAVRTIIYFESSGDPCAINLWDSNALAGIPSKGLIQAIDPTFRAYKLPGYEDTYHPVDSIIAGVRYARGRYGSESRVPGVVGVRAGRGYVGY